MYAMGVDSAWISALLLDLARGRLSGPEIASAALLELPAASESNMK